MKYIFHVWHKQEKRWVNDAFMNQSGVIGHDTILNPSINLIAYQNTGIKSENGQFIYEGDILACPWHFVPGQCLYGVVVFWQGAFHLAKFKRPEFPEDAPYEFFNYNETPSRRDMWKHAKIVGNICETTVWVRESSEDRRIKRGDDFAGDAWRNVLTKDIKYTTVEYKLSKTYPFKT